MKTFLALNSFENVEAKVSELVDVHSQVGHFIVDVMFLNVMKPSIDQSEVCNLQDVWRRSVTFEGSP